MRLPERLVFRRLKRRGASHGAGPSHQHPVPAPLPRPCRLGGPTSNKWSAPAFVRVTGVELGLVAGMDRVRRGGAARPRLAAACMAPAERRDPTPFYALNPARRRQAMCAWPLPLPCLNAHLTPTGRRRRWWG